MPDNTSNQSSDVLDAFLKAQSRVVDTLGLSGASQELKDEIIRAKAQAHITRDSLVNYNAGNQFYLGAMELAKNMGFDPKEIIAPFPKREGNTVIIQAPPEQQKINNAPAPTQVPLVQENTEPSKLRQYATVGAIALASLLGADKLGIISFFPKDKEEIREPGRLDIDSSLDLDIR